MPALVCVNNWDLNPEICSRIEVWAREHGLGLAGRVRYDRAVTAAQVNGRAVVEYQQDGCAEDIRSVWREVAAYLETDRTEDANLRVRMPELRNPV
jgi:MinD superfamily P-loop ATPase